MKSVSSYRANHYLSVSLLQFKRASISEEETKGKKRKGSRINNDKGLVFFFVFLLSDGMFRLSESWEKPLNLVDTQMIEKRVLISDEVLILDAFSLCIEYFPELKENSLIKKKKKKKSNKASVCICSRAI